VAVEGRGGNESGQRIASLARLIPHQRATAITYGVAMFMSVMDT
jgi:hypothetical protein